MLARLLASWLLVVQIVPTLCCLLMQEAPVRLAHWGAAPATPPETSCCVEPEAACHESAPADVSECDVAPAQMCCDPCPTVCTTDQPAPLERKEQRRENGRQLAPEVLFADGSYPSAPRRAPSARVAGPSETVRWTSAERLRPFLQVWLI